MDRFIGIRFVLVSFFVCTLKSNMDRFIAISSFITDKDKLSLKSNMDRFIDRNLFKQVTEIYSFKIQYG